VFYFQIWLEGIIIFKNPGFIIRFLKTAAPLTVKREIVLKRLHLIKHFLLSSTGLMACIFFSFKANIETLSRRDPEPLNFELRAECKAI